MALTTRRLLLTVAVALLVATAGCSSLTGGSDGGDGGDGTDSGYGVAGSELNGTTIEEATLSAVNEAGSYTLTSNISFVETVDARTYNSTTTTTTRVDFDAGRGIRNEQSMTTGGVGSDGHRTTIVYTAGNTSYRNVTQGGETQYTASSEEGAFVRPVNVTTFDGNYQGLVEDIEWEQSGNGSVGGVAVTEYTLVSIENTSALDLGENATINSSSGTLALDADGVVRQMSFSYEADLEDGTRSVAVVQTLTDIGETSVEEPDWLSEAQS